MGKKMAWDGTEVCLGLLNLVSVDGRVQLMLHWGKLAGERLEGGLDGARGDQRNDAGCIGDGEEEEKKRR